MTNRIYSRIAMTLACLLVLGWIAGLVGFIDQVVSYGEPKITENLPATDAIIVLTGGSERVSTGVDLLKAGKGKKLFVSGVYPGVGAGKILGSADIPADLRDCCVVLGHAADNTIGNAEETQVFMEAENYRSLRLVTANYHMPRSLFLFRAILSSEIAIEPYPVTPDVVMLRDWWRSPGTLSLLAHEYNKYLVARLRWALGAL